jgi:hypothetical protein
VKTYVDHVIQGTMLSNSDKNRLVVRSRVDRRQPVGTRRETTSDIGGKNTVLCCIIETLEERELLRVRHGRLGERVQEVNNDVRVSLNAAIAGDLLRRREVVLLSVHEEAGVKVVDRHLDRERLILVESLTVHREDELRRGHLRLGSNDTHRRRVAGAGRDLLAVGDRKVGDGQAEVDEVVARGERRDLAGRRLVLTIVLEARGNDSGIQGCKLC